MLGLGYIFTRVTPKRHEEVREVTINGVKEKRRYVRIDFEIEEGPQAYVENIIIKGNKKTKDKVIRREVIIKEGELFSSYKMQMTRERIYNLGYFKEVNIDLRPGSKEGYMNLIVDVQEQPSGTISLGGGYGTSTGFSIFAEVGENNFMGNGQTASTRFEYGPSKTYVSLNFTEPWLFDYPVAFTTTVFYSLSTVTNSSLFLNSSDTSTYKSESIGYALGLTYRFWYYYGLGVRWQHSWSYIKEPTGNSPDDIFVEKSLGYQQKRGLTFYAYRSSKDNNMNPTRGMNASMSVTFMGGNILRGQSHYIKYDPELYLYVTPFHLPFLNSHPCVIELRATGSFITPPLQKTQIEQFQHRANNEWLKQDDRMLVGGPETLRGWDYYDYDLPDSWRIYLYHRILYGAEFRVPVHPQYLWAVFFFDAGSLWSDAFWNQRLSSSYKTVIQSDLDNGLLYDIKSLPWAVQNGKIMGYFRYSWGFGFKIQLPMMPLRFWFGKKMIWTGAHHGYFKEISDFNFQFSIGDTRY